MIAVTQTDSSLESQYGVRSVAESRQAFVTFEVTFEKSDLGGNTRQRVPERGLAS